MMKMQNMLFYLDLFLFFVVKKFGCFAQFKWIYVSLAFLHFWKNMYAHIYTQHTQTHTHTLIEIDRKEVVVLYP